MNDRSSPITPAEEYGKHYMGPIFYFCLRKTGDTHTAEDLTSDITLQIMTALHNGVTPRHFSAWIWQIARNRYALWTKSRRHEAEHMAPVDLDDPAAVAWLSDQAEDFVLPSVDSEYVRSEEMATLRRELAFLGRDWRDVVVAYYIEDRSVASIAASLGVAEGTVKSRLFRARDLLKEGMNMARTFGPKSYKPETVRFAASGSQPYGWPWNGVERSLQKNILLEASGNPSTAEELAVAVGVSMPYMEEEIALLVEGNLLKSVGKRYVTNFYIESREIQLEIDRLIQETVASVAANFATLCRDLIPLYRRLAMVPTDMSDDRLLWLIVPRTVDALAEHCVGYTIDAGMNHKHPGETWSFIGFEGDMLPDRWLIGHNGCGGDNECTLWTYDFVHPKMNFHNNRMQFSWDDPLFLCELLYTGRPIASLSDTEERNWQRISKGHRIAHVGEDGRAVCDIPIFPKGTFRAIYEEILRHPVGHSLQATMQTQFDRIVAILSRESHEVLKVQIPYCASMHLFDVRPMLVDALLTQGALTIPENPGECVVAAYITGADV